MTGIVEFTNPRRGMAAVRTAEGYSIVEMLGDDVEIGDELSWRAQNPLGGATIRNLTQGTEMEVFFQDHHFSRSRVRAQLLL